MQIYINGYPPPIANGKSKGKKLAEGGGVPPLQTIPMIQVFESFLTSFPT